MKQIAQVLRTAFYREMRGMGLDRQEEMAWLKWLRFYLDFCHKYGHAPRSEGSLSPFLEKIAAKNQCEERQQQAAASIRLYYQLLPALVGADAGLTAPPEGGGNQGACITLLEEEIKLRQYSPRTLSAYRGWVRDFLKFHDGVETGALEAEHARAYLTHLAVGRQVTASTQNQAFNALLFLFRHVLKRDYELGDSVVRAKRRRYIPVVLSREEIDSLLEVMAPPSQLVTRLLYACGLRLAEGLNLRVQDFNLDGGLLTVHRGKGGKDRTVPLPRRMIPELKEHLVGLRKLHENDMSAGFHGAFMPRGSPAKWNRRAREWPWQFFFPAQNLTLVPEENELRRYHLHPTQYSKELRKAARETSINKRVTAHTFRHSFASHLLLANYDIRTIQEMLGHSDVRTTMIYTHTVESRTVKERMSPYDFTAGDPYAPGIE